MTRRAPTLQIELMSRHAGIVGIGTYLPDQVRTNDWWPRSVVDAWMSEPRLPPPPAAQLTEGMRRVIRAMSEQVVDPFLGMVERRVMPEHMSSVDMEVRAAERALDRAGIDRSKIDLLLTHTAVPEYLLSNSACVLHHALGLQADCFTMQAEASGYSFMMQLTIACEMIASGQASHALLVQSAAGSRLLDREDSQSPLFGDGAAAVVVSAVPTRQILATVHRTDGRFPRALVASVRGKRWYDDGRVVLHRGDPEGTRQVFLETADQAGSAIRAVLDKAGLDTDAVAFIAMHQGTPWLRQVTMETAGVTRAAYVDVFDTKGYLFGASIPFVLEAGEATGRLVPGATVVLCGGGIGATYGAIAMTWGNVAP